MKLLFALTYYHPHISGLTVYVGRLAEALAARGSQVTVLTSQHDPALPREEMHNGVRVVRVPVAFRVGKAAFMPSYLKYALPLLGEHDLALLNLPATPFESVTLTMLARFFVRRPLAAVYHCDIRLPAGLLNRVTDAFVSLNNLAAGLLLTRIIVTTQDYADHSAFLRRFRHKLEIVPPAVLMPPPGDADAAAFRRSYAPRGERLVGFAARFASEKGVEHLLDALPRIRAEIPDVKIVFTGDPRKVLGEEQYWRRMQPRLAEAGDACAFLGMLDWRQMAAFYSACDVTTLPSVNSTESFGLAQLESMLCGTPVVASDLPGVRVPVLTTKMGRIVPPADASALADAIVDCIRRRREYVRPRAEIESHFSFEAMLMRYEELFARLLAEKQPRR